MSLEQVGKRAGVSIATVSRVLNGTATVSEPTRQRVLEAIKELNYAPSYAARALARHATKTLGVVFPDLDSGFYTEVLKGISAHAGEQDYEVVFAFGHSTTDGVRLVRQYVMERRVDALIVMNLQLPGELLDNLDTTRVPVVLMDRPADNDSGMVVAIDNKTGAYQAMQHLLGPCGVRDVAIITGPKDSTDSRLRISGCRQAAREAGVKLHASSLWHGTFREDSGFDAVRTRLEAGQRMPQAIFALNDRMALGAMDALRVAGLRVPDDVRIVGFDDEPVARHLGLSTVHVPMQEFGAKAVEAAVMQIRGESPPDDWDPIVRTRFVPRRTCGSED
ncbi:LacI family DNA-binding transcriptional regulator [Mucisphaera calidilacus]|uniref:Ribose operon repressor n=1 Tax=Mucisphaera calidilacus TaxID=2527982 RepID=A0A518BUM5_9BACT|nr:LacI family DNA-binding transcriptional regulator [Mucisphaera calidilacus]QDU70689.1 Ribose operon repressor [Mucisphaera calidilacus]